MLDFNKFVSLLGKDRAVGDEVGPVYECLFLFEFLDNLEIELTELLSLLIKQLNHIKVDFGGIF